jgi:hypothetical protein
MLHLIPNNEFLTRLTLVGHQVVNDAYNQVNLQEGRSIWHGCQLRLYDIDMLQISPFGSAMQMST